MPKQSILGQLVANQRLGTRGFLGSLLGGSGLDLLSGTGRGGSGQPASQGGLSGGSGSSLLSARSVETLTSFADVYNGGVGIDSIDALDGSDTVFGAGGNDTLFGASARDTLFGGDNDDFLFGGHGDDVVEGGSGIDQIFGGGLALQFDSVETLAHVTSARQETDPHVSRLTDGNGGFAIVWTEALDSASSGTVIRLQRYDETGSSVGAQVSVDTLHPGRVKGEAEVYALQGPNAGQYLVVWYSEDTADPLNIHSAYMARFNASGTQLGSTVQISQSNDFPESQPVVTTLADGTWVTTWQDLNRDTGDTSIDAWGIYAARWTISGSEMTQTPAGGEVRVNVSVSGDQTIPYATLLSNGNMVVAWTDSPDGLIGSTSVSFRLVDPDGGAGGRPAPLGGNDTQVNVTTANVQFAGGVAALAAGGFVVVWRGNGTQTGEADSDGVFFRVYNNSGTAVTGELRANTTTSGEQTEPTVVALHGGGFVVFWESDNLDGSLKGVVGQRFDDQGNEIGSEFVVNTTTGGNQGQVQAAEIDHGTIIVTWSGKQPVGSGNDIYFRALRFGSSGGDDTLSGNDAADQLFGEDGNDTLAGGTGADVLNGATGQDWASYLTSAAAVTVNLSDLATELGGEAQGDSLTAIEHVFGGSGADSLTGNDLANSLVGNSGADRLAGRTGADYLSGGSGLDTADYAASVAVAVNLSDGATETGGDAAGDTLTGIENLIGGSGADSLIGQLDDTINTLVGNSGGDLLQGGSGADSLYGGSGVDRVSYVTSTQGVTVDLSIGTAQAGGEAQGDILNSIENLTGSALVDRLAGNAVDNLLQGAQGDDILVASLGADVLQGNAGLDTVDYRPFGSGVSIDLTSLVVQALSIVDANDALGSIENAVGSSFADIIRGSSVVNTLVGDDGNDTLEGRGGADSLVGGSGLDWADYSGSAGAVTVTLGDGVAEVGNDAQGDVLTGIEAVLGSAANDTLMGDAGNNILNGATGDDFFFADLGNDSYIGDTGMDTIDYRQSTAAVTVNLLTGAGSGGLAQGDVYSGVDNVLGSSFLDLITGSTSANTLHGFSGGDSLDGDQGVDTLFGGSGNDLLRGGAGAQADHLDGGDGNDTATYSTSGPGVTVNLTTGLGSGGQAQGDTYTAIENVIGSNSADVIVGKDGLNTLLGGGGLDSLHGASGADSLFGEAGDDVVFFDTADVAVIGGTGRDTLQGNSGVDAIQMNAARFTFAGNFAAFEVVNLGDGNDYYLGSSNAADFNQILGSGVSVFGGSGNDNITFRGNNAAAGNDDYADGGEGNDYIWGGGGEDTFYGGGGSDNFYGGFGDDTISGGAGFDVTYVGRNEGNDVVTDSEGLVLFWGHDGGPVYDGVDPSEISIVYGVSDVTITFDTGGSVSFAKSSVEIINLFDYGNGDAGNGPAPPPTYLRDIWSASWDSGSQTFGSFTKLVDG